MTQLYEIGQVVGFVDLVDRASEAEFQMRSTAKWFCAVTNPNCQARAALGLYELGYRTFYPKSRRWVSHARVRKAKETPVLGRYIFVEVDCPVFDHCGKQIHEPEQSFHDVRSVNGIESLVGPMGIPTPFPEHWVDGLRGRYMAGEWDEVAKGPIPVGARVRVLEGEFADVLATVTSFKRGWLQCKIKDRNQYTKQAKENVRAA